MGAEIANKADCDPEVITRLPLDIECVVDRVGQLVGTIVRTERKGLGTVGNISRSRQIVVDIGCLAAGRIARLHTPGVRERVVATRVRHAVRGWGRTTGVIDIALDSIHKRWSLVYAKRATRYLTCGVAGRQIAEEFAAIVVHAGTTTNDDLARKHRRLPRCAEAGCDAPLPASQRRIADALGPLAGITGDDEAIARNRARRLVVRILARMEVRDAAVLLR